MKTSKSAINVLALTFVEKFLVTLEWIVRWEQNNEGHIACNVLKNQNVFLEKLFVIIATTQQSTF